MHTVSDEPKPEEIVTAQYSSQEEWGWGREACRYIHDQIKRTIKHDIQVLYNRTDLAPDDKDSYHAMETGLVEGNIYLDSACEAVEHSADAIAQRFYR